ncbi:MAG TPA: GNAT family N-acetyltransferase [Jatrophihabitantaceae bacterium]|jgi:predicted GNAT superfamily acetyltransferase
MVRIQELNDTAAIRDAAALFDAIWGTGGDGRATDPSGLRALAHTGNYLAGVYDGQRLIGASVGFFAEDGHLHSHITGIAAEYQGQGIGRLLKLHQRDWALARGRTAISWTFDPLIARNAYFNLHSLGAAVVEYLLDFYGEMNDAVNAGDATDRLYVLWALNTPAPPAPSVADVPALVARDGNQPVSHTVDAPRLSVATPADIEKLRAHEPELAVRWRMAVRDAMAGALAEGYRVTGITRDGHYLLEVHP